MYHRQANSYNYTKASRNKWDLHYIVVHYDAGKKATARNNVDAFTHLLSGTSAHYFVDENEVAMSLDPRHIAHHCGGKKYANGAPAPLHGICRNANSIGVELCSDFVNGKYIITEATALRGAGHVAWLMREYDIPIDRVVRHYDVTGKHCPMPYVDEAEWKKFKDLVIKTLKETSKESQEVGEKMVYYEKLTDIPDGVIHDTVEKYVEMGIIKGDSRGLHLSEDMARMVVFQERRIQELLKSQA